MKRQILLPIALTMTALLAGPQGAKSESIAVFTRNNVNPFDKAIRQGSDAAAKNLKVDVSHYVPTTPGNVAEQTKLVDDAIAKKPDAILFDPVDVAALVSAVQKVNAAGIPVIDINDRSPDGKFVSYVLPDDHQLGLATASVLLKAMGGKGNVVILEGIPTLVTSLERVKGFNEAIKEFPDVKLLASKSAQYQCRPA
jgi:ribose transport system substrate-binding protein